MTVQPFDKKFKMLIEIYGSILHEEYKDAKELCFYIQIIFCRMAHIENTHIAGTT